MENITSTIAVTTPAQSDEPVGITTNRTHADYLSDYGEITPRVLDTHASVLRDFQKTMEKVVASSLVPESTKLRVPIWSLEGLELVPESFLSPYARELIKDKKDPADVKSWFLGNRIINMLAFNIFFDSLVSDNSYAPYEHPVLFYLSALGWDEILAEMLQVDPPTYLKITSDLGILNLGKLFHKAYALRAKNKRIPKVMVHSATTQWGLALFAYILKSHPAKAQTTVDTRSSDSASKTRDKKQKDEFQLIPVLKEQSIIALSSPAPVSVFAGLPIRTTKIVGSCMDVKGIGTLLPSGGSDTFKVAPRTVTGAVNRDNYIADLSKHYEKGLVQMFPLYIPSTDLGIICGIVLSDKPLLTRFNIEKSVNNGQARLSKQSSAQPAYNHFDLGGATAHIDVVFSDNANFAQYLKEQRVDSDIYVTYVGTPALELAGNSWNYSAAVALFNMQLEEPFFRPVCAYTGAVQSSEYGTVIGPADKIPEKLGAATKAGMSLLGLTSGDTGMELDHSGPKFYQTLTLATAKYIHLYWEKAGSRVHAQPIVVPEYDGTAEQLLAQWKFPKNWQTDMKKDVVVGSDGKPDEKLKESKWKSKVQAVIHSMEKAGMAAYPDMNKFVTALERQLTISNVSKTSIAKELAGLKKSVEDSQAKHGSPTGILGSLVARIKSLSEAKPKVEVTTEKKTSPLKFPYTASYVGGDTPKVREFKDAMEVVRLVETGLANKLVDQNTLIMKKWNGKNGKVNSKIVFVRKDMKFIKSLLERLDPSTSREVRLGRARPTNVMSKATKYAPTQSDQTHSMIRDSRVAKMVESGEEYGGSAQIEEDDEESKEEEDRDKEKEGESEEEEEEETVVPEKTPPARQAPKVLSRGNQYTEVPVPPTKESKRTKNK